MYGAIIIPGMRGYWHEDFKRSSPGRRLAISSYDIAMGGVCITAFHEEVYQLLGPINVKQW